MQARPLIHWSRPHRLLPERGNEWSVTSKLTPPGGDLLALIFQTWGCFSHESVTSQTQSWQCSWAAHQNLLVYRKWAVRASFDCCCVSHRVPCGSCWLKGRWKKQLFHRNHTKISQQKQRCPGHQGIILLPKEENEWVRKTRHQYTQAKYSCIMAEHRPTGWKAVHDISLNNVRLRQDKGTWKVMFLP